MKVKQIQLHEQWFSIPGDVDGGSILIREVSDADTVGYTMATVGFGRDSGEDMAVGFLKKFYAGHMVDWKNLSDETGKSLSLSYANKLLLLEQTVHATAAECKKLGIGEKNTTVPLIRLIESWVTEVRLEGEKKRGVAEKN